MAKATDVGYGSMNADILASTLADYEAQVEDLTQRLTEKVADLLETRSQRAHLARQLAAAAEQAIEHAKRHAEIFDEWVRERAELVDERDDLAKTLESEREHHKAVREYAVARQAERDEARDEVVRLGRENDQLRSRVAVHSREATRYIKEAVRLRTIIVELGAGEAAEPPELGRAITEDELIAERKSINEVDFRRESLGEWPPEAAYWTDDADGDPGGPFRSRS